MSANSVCDAISYHQGHELILSLEKAGLNSKLAQAIIESRGNKKAEAMLAVLNVEQPDDRFEQISEFIVVVPKGYNHDTRLDTFAKEHRKEFYSYNDSITDKNFSKATTKLVAGRKFKVKIIQIKSRVSSEDCLAHLRSHKAVLVGAQGTSLAYEQAKDKLPVSRWSVSFDEKEALWKDADGYRRVPRVHRGSGGGFEFGLAPFENDWDGHLLSPLLLRHGRVLGRLDACLVWVSDPLSPCLVVYSTGQGLIFVYNNVGIWIAHAAMASCYRILV